AALEAMDASERVAIHSGFLEGTTAAENWLADTLRNQGRHGIPAQLGDKHANIPTPDFAPNTSRFPDYLEDAPNGKVSHEMKYGTPPAGSPLEESALKQCAQDAHIRNNNLGGVVETVWHFVPRRHTYHGKEYNSVGPSAALLKCLQDNAIPFVIYLP
ncbi:MAG: hypothetical protein J2P17_36155, partial [Mycobacterium sp.]|nr:hypothetical protein [Mycobacterium sp.]